MADFDNPDWNLSQVAAWAVYRETKLVDELAYPRPHDFAEIGMYPTMWPKHRQIYGSLADVHASLRNGSIEAHGYHCDSPNLLQVIPRKEWADLHLSPPFAYMKNNRNPRFQSWKYIRLESSAVKKHWRSTSETIARSKFDWDEVCKLYYAAAESNPEFSQNELIDETQRMYQERYNREAPSRTSFMRRLKDWK